MCAQNMLKIKTAYLCFFALAKWVGSVAY